MRHDNHILSPSKTVTDREGGKYPGTNNIINFLKDSNGHNEAPNCLDIVKDEQAIMPGFEELSTYPFSPQKTA
ncbi:hypothetical protein RRG08_030716 [Elysia crispata]|uniref:Uncharacterized protein n=1 Tax=Elysia crispata TaxID=231223 RepID=A0AAE0Y5C0_9GAST|nr:hypothetical protein RRG08_030716 [Elysia crispata]